MNLVTSPFGPLPTKIPWSSDSESELESDSGRSKNLRIDQEQNVLSNYKFAKQYDIAQDKLLDTNQSIFQDQVESVHTCFDKQALVQKRFHVRKIHKQRFYLVNGSFQYNFDSHNDKNNSNNNGNLFDEMTKHYRDLKTMSHPNIETFKCFETTTIFYQFCDYQPPGQSIFDYLIKMQDKFYNINCISQILWQISNALNECHSSNLKHLHLKPENILIFPQIHLNINDKRLNYDYEPNYNSVLGRESWKIGTKVKVFSQSNRKWYVGEIVHINTDDQGEWLTVMYVIDPVTSTTRLKQISRYCCDIVEYRDKDDDIKNDHNETRNGYNYLKVLITDMAFGELHSEAIKENIYFCLSDASFVAPELLTFNVESEQIMVG